MLAGRDEVDLSGVVGSSWPALFLLSLLLLLQLTLICLSSSASPDLEQGRRSPWT